MIYYKALTANRVGPYSNWQWPEPGIWTPEISELVRCKHGYHVANQKQLITWLTPHVWEVEVDESRGIAEDDKLIVPRARLIKPSGIFGNGKFENYLADVAEHVLHLFESVYPADDRPRKAIEAARSGDKTAAANAAYANAAAYAAYAAYAAAYAANAYAAAYAAYAAYAAAYAAAAAANAYAAAAAANAYAAAYAADDAAAYAAAAAANAYAAYAAANAEREWQVDLLGQYLRGEK